MVAPPIPSTEELRLAELERLGLLYTPPEEVFDRITAELARIFDVPVSTMSLIDRDVQFYKSHVGLPPELAASPVVPRALSICGHVVGNNEALVVSDLTQDERFADNPMVLQSGARFYAGAPLRTETGYPVGTLCIIDRRPRDITEREKALLQLVANELMREVELRRVTQELGRISDTLSRRNQLIERDLMQAEAVQRYLLPQGDPEHPAFVFSYVYHPFQHIGGDFLDVLVRPDGTAAVLLADVSGHGASAAMTAAMTKTAFLRAAPRVQDPTHLLQSVHRDLSPAVPEGQFMTAIAALYSPEERTIWLASAGHPYPVVIRREHGLARASRVTMETDLPLLLDRDYVYRQSQTVKLGRSDRVLLYTDGAIEAANSDGEHFGETRLLQAASEFSSEPGREALQQLFNRILTFAGRLQDDVAIVALEGK